MAIITLDDLVGKSIENHDHRQTETFNLIPSENTPSTIVRLASALDPSGRYGEHKRIKAFGKGDTYYYQGIDFIREVEEIVRSHLKDFLGASEVELRPISGTMANDAVFSALVSYFNRFEQGDPKRLGYVVNHYLGKGGHLSAQQLGALGPHVRKDRREDGTGKWAIANFPVQEDNPYQIDLDATRELIERLKDQLQLIILGKSMVLHREPVREIADMISGIEKRPFLMYDSAHVSGLLGPNFQNPLQEGADILTGSLHKTYPGTQRGFIATNMSEGTDLYALMEKFVSQAFPGKTSNHHLGSLHGLAYACLEMSVFGNDYQRQTMANSKAFARALKERGISVEGDSSIGYTETHQVVINVGKENGASIADRLEKNNLITNFQTLPNDSSSPTAASGIRMGVQEMTRFGMKEKDFEKLADYVADVVLRNQDRAKEIAQYRKQFLDMQYTFTGDKKEKIIAKMVSSLVGPQDMQGVLRYLKNHQPN
ncbi:MAG TPA: hypothetical protein VJI97_02770 [Candidatus Nanoarchaeia archaeon]|nr:hypothetical protein [Candidatus Nanoarchaeia archaeon]